MRTAAYCPPAAMTELRLVALYRPRPFFSLRRVGGIRFLRVGRLNVSWSVAREVQS